MCETDIQERRREGSAEVERERGGVEDLGDALLRFCSFVLSGPLDGLDEGLPVIVVDEWREFCETDIQERRREAAGRFRERGEEMCRAEDLGDALLQFCSVVLSAPLDGLYEGLPVIVVDEWREFARRTREAVGRWREREKEIFTAEY